MSTNIASLVSQQLDIWATAIERKSGAGRGNGGKLNLYGIDKLRALILDLAVRGMLVPQEATDEPATNLLSKIAIERKVLQKAGKIAKPKKLSPILPDELPIPPSWEAARFGAVFSLEYGDNLPQTKRSETGEYNVFGSNGIVGTHHSYTVDRPCLVVGRKGSAGAINKSYEPCWVTDVAYYSIPPMGIDLNFQHILFQTLSLDKLGKGIKPGLNRNEANVLAVPIPPSTEQQRIVAKVDELMALCDELEAQSATALEGHQALAETLLTTLVESADATDLVNNWARLETHFDSLFTTETSIDALAKSVLELGVRGFLVSQNEDDPEVILPTLREFSKSSNWDEKIFRHGCEQFDLPKGWQFAPLAQVASNIVDCPHTTPKWTNEGELCIRTNQIKSRHLDLSKPNYVTPETYSERIERLEPRAGDILYIREGGILGVGCRIPEGVKLCLGQRSMLIRSSPIIDSKYLEIVLNSPFIVGLAEYFTTGGAAPRVNMSTVRGYAIPVPPLPEQRRIVSKVDSLITLCEELKSRITEAADIQRTISDSIVQRAAA